MKPTITHKEARAWAEQLRRELLRQKRSVGDPRAPMRARPGQEEAFAKVEADIATADFILKLIDCDAQTDRARGLVLRALDLLLTLGLLTIGLPSLVMLGVFAVAAHLYGRGLAAPALAIIGLAAFLTWRAVRNPRK